MNIRKATYEDIPRLMEIFCNARQIMRDSGNMHQWNDGYPSEIIVRKDIEEGVCMVACDDEGVSACMALIPGPDPTYAHIYEDEDMTVETSWPDDSPYHVIHRIASTAPGQNVARRFLDWAFSMPDISAIRIDTHKDNVIMHHILQDYGFRRCGIIRLQSGDTRVAYIKTSGSDISDSRLYKADEVGR